MKKLSEKGRKRLRSIWKAMNQRCYRENFSEYKHYGGMGIKVCDEWSDGFLRFEQWAIENGYDENADRKSCTLDRIDPFGDYTPDNCRWSDMRTQNANRKINAIHDLSDEFLYREEVAELFGVPVERVDEMAKREMLPHMRIGGQRLYCKTVVEQFKIGLAESFGKRTPYHRWTDEEDAMILEPSTFDLDELSKKIGLSDQQIKTRLYRLGTSWGEVVRGGGKIAESKTSGEQLT